MLEVKNLIITINDKIVIDDLNFTINETDKMAIIGEEGNGKSTLLKAIYGTLDYANISGTINSKGNILGYLEQEVNNRDLTKSVMEYLFLDEEDYYMKTSNLYKILKELNVSDEILFVKKIKKLSGGEKVKLQILKVLLSEPDILLLDEPTNDLDIKTLNWLEQFIANSCKPIIYVSHDETLLSRTANMILHLELFDKKKTLRCTVLKTTYDDYVEKRLNSIIKQTQVAKKEKKEYKEQQNKLNQVMNKVEYKLRTISRSDPHGGQLLKKKMKSIKSQERRFENQELTEIPDSEEAINFFFENINMPSKKEILILDVAILKINDKILSTNIKLNVYGSEHIAIIGNNGVGKTTLMKIIKDQLISRKDINVGYMPQEYDDVLKYFDIPMDYLTMSGDKDEISLIRSYMGNMRFTKEEMTGKITNLSGGSKAKLLLLKLILMEYNVLLLDEPTRNVSPLSNPAIRNALSKYKGTIISISHDRKYINEVCDKVYEMTATGLIEKNKYFL